MIDPTTPTKYPVAEAAHPGSTGSTVACVHCKTPLMLGGWDKLNGFLVQCPACGGAHGRPWSARSVGLISFILNALSFLFTMRPAKAAAVIVAWVAGVWLVGPRFETLPDALQVTCFIVVLLGPLVVNMSLLVRHQIDLDRHPINRRAT